MKRLPVQLAIILLSIVVFVGALYGYFQFRKDQSFRQHCKKVGEEIWDCSGFGATEGAANEVAKVCESRGLKFECSGHCVSARCYRFADEAKPCTDSKQCLSGNCIPDDVNCPENCAGKCAGVYPPNMCDARQVFSTLHDGKVTKIETGGAFCD